MNIVLVALLMQAASAPAAPAPVDDAALYADCVRAAEAGVPGAVDAASRWLRQDGGLAARHCLGLAYLGANQPAQAAAAFEAAARVAESSGSPAAAELYGQAGNAALLAGDAARAETMLDSAIVLAARQDAVKGALLVDRARARQARGNNAGARGDLESAVKLAPGDADGWLLLAVLARHEERLADSRQAIGQALRLAPESPDVQLEAGNMAALDGDFARARSLWSSAATAAPGTPAAAAAEDALRRNPQ